MCRRLFIATSIALAPSFVLAAPPVHVAPWSQSVQTAEWYQEQAEAWLAVVDKQPTNAQAWRNLFAATRYAHKKAGKAYDEPQKGELLAILEQMSRRIPTSYEYFECALSDFRIAPASEATIERALALYPDSAGLQLTAMLFYEQTAQPEKLRAVALRSSYLSRTEHWMLDHSYNLLNTPQKGAVLLVDGDIAFTASLLQSALGIRPDVTLLHCTFVENDEQYLGRKLATRGYASISYVCPEGDRGKAYRTVLLAMNQQHPEIPVYFAVWVSQRCLPPYDELYLEGLAFHWSLEPVQNLQALCANFGNVYRLDYVWSDWGNTHPWYPNACMNYAAGLMDLARHYRTVGDKARETRTLDLLRVVLKRAGRTDEALAALESHIFGK